MGNVLGINTVTNTVFVRNSGTVLDTLYSVTIFAACNKGALLSNNTNWIVSSAVNSENSGKLDVTFTYDNSGASLSIAGLSSAISMGLVEGIGAIVNVGDVVVHWTRYNGGAINIASSVETTVSLMYTFANYTFNNNIKFTSSDYIVNYDKTCPQEYSPVKSIISSTITEDGHNVVVIGSVTVGPGLWYIVCSGGFNLTNKKYFFLADRIESEVSNYNEYIRGDEEIMSSFGTHHIASSNNSFLGYDDAAILRITITVGTTQYSENIVSVNYTDADDLFNAVVDAMNTAYPAGNFGFDVNNAYITSSVQYTFNFSTMNTGLSNAIVGDTNDITAYGMSSSYFVINVMNGYGNFEGYDATTTPSTIKFTVDTTQYSEDIVSDNYTDVNAFLGAVVNAMNIAYPAGNFAFDNVTKIISSDIEYIFDFSTMNSDLSNALISSTGNIYPVNTSMVYTGDGSSNVVRWCFTCEDEDNSASSIIFNNNVTSTNTYVNGRPNNLVMCAIKISS